MPVLYETNAGVLCVPVFSVLVLGVNLWDKNNLKYFVSMAHSMPLPRKKMLNPEEPGQTERQKL